MLVAELFSFCSSSLGLPIRFLGSASHNLQDIYIVWELMETDLASILKSPQPLSTDQAQFFLYQVIA